MFVMALFSEEIYEVHTEGCPTLTMYRLPKNMSPVVTFDVSYTL